MFWSVKVGSSSLGFFSREFNKSNTFGSTIWFHEDLDICDLSTLSKEWFYILFGSFICQFLNENFERSLLSTSRLWGFLNFFLFFFNLIVLCSWFFSVQCFCIFLCFRCFITVRSFFNFHFLSFFCISLWSLFSTRKLFIGTLKFFF